MTDVLNPSYFLDPEAPADWFISFPLKDCDGKLEIAALLLKLLVQKYSNQG
jgi:hypothetical protein